MFDLSGEGDYVLGAIGVTVDPGCQYTLDSSNAPWKIAEPDEDCEMMAQVSRFAGMI